MARRRKNDESGFELLFDIAALLPWPVGVAIAVVIFTGLHLYAGSAPPSYDPTLVTSGMENVVGSVARKIAGIAKYVLSIIVLAGAAVSFLGARRKRKLHAQVAKAPSEEALNHMTWQEFEALVGEAFRQKGFSVVERGGEGPDGGVDLELYYGKDRYLVQCKQWKTRQVGVATVRELYGVMAAEGAVGGYVVASGAFTPDAQEFAQGRSIRLVDARKLKSLIDQNAKRASGPARAAEPAYQAVTQPTCPICGGVMVERLAKKGAQAGTKFWGCAQYPKCRGTHY